MHRASILLLGLLSASLPPQAARADWPEELAAEIEAVEHCTVAFFSNAVEREVNGLQVIMVKVHCEVQRRFDAWRDDPLGAFHFALCTEKVRTC